jgi:hypothetical protein
MLALALCAPMPHYYFHVHDGESRPDHEGVDLPSRNAAWSEAVRCCGQMLKDIDGRMGHQAEWRMEVVDGLGQPVFTPRFVGTEHGSHSAANSN